MVSCSFCNTDNTLDSAFCRRCGKAIPQAQILGAKARLESLVAEGFEHLGQNRADEALAAADAVLASDPASARAWSLRGLCLERRGEVAEALGCFEAALRYDGESAADRIKAAQLQQVVAVKEMNVPPPDRRLALAAGFAATLLAITLGAFAATRGGGVRVAMEDGAAKQSFSASTFDPITAQLGDKLSQPTAAQPSASTQEANEAASPAPLRTAPPIEGILPKAFVNQPEREIETRPFALPGAIEIKPLATEQPPKPDIKVSLDPEPKSSTSLNEPPAENPGVIDIRLSDPERPGVSGSEPIDANGVEALVRTARGQFQVGNYEAAASTYERALSAGADAAGTNQRLAQCYERLGRQSDAVAAYQKAIAGFEAALRSGKGNSDRLQTALESSRQALRLLQGG